MWAPAPQRAAWEALRAVGDTLPLAPARTATARRERLGTAVGHAADAGWTDDADDDGYAPLPRDAHAAVIADYNAVGLSVAGHPMARYRAWCRRVGAASSADLAGCLGGERVVVAGMVIVRQRPATANGTVFLLLEDDWGTSNVIVPTAVDARDREPVRHGAFVLALGRAERDGPLVNVIARRVEAFGPEVVRGAATQPAGSGAVTRIGGPAAPNVGPPRAARPHAERCEEVLRHRSHDFR